MPFGKHGKTKLGDKALTLKEVKDQYPDYVTWLLAQDGFKEKNAALYEYFTTGPKEPTAAEAANNNAEDQILSVAPQEFKDWWKAAYGERLRKDGNTLYIGYLRVAFAGFQTGYGVAKFKYDHAHPKTEAIIHRPTNPSPVKNPELFTDEVAF